jgi:hypothetical protein
VRLCDVQTGVSLELSGHTAPPQTSEQQARARALGSAALVAWKPRWACRGVQSQADASPAEDRRQLARRLGRAPAEADVAPSSK